VKLLSEFLSCLGNDVGRDNPSLSSLSPSPAPRTLSHALKLVKLTEHVERGAQSMGQVLRLLVENEILRLNVWNNPSNDPKRGADSIGTVDKSMNDVSSSIMIPSGSTANAPPPPRQTTWTTSARQTWQLDPGIAIHLTERFSVPALESEVTRLVRSNPLACIDVPDALKFLIGDGLDPAFRRDLRVRIPFHILTVLVHVRLVPLVVVLSSTDHCYFVLRTSIPQRSTHPAICTPCVGTTSR